MMAPRFVVLGCAEPAAARALGLVRSQWPLSRWSDSNPEARAKRGARERGHARGVQATTFRPRADLARFVRVVRIVESEVDAERTLIPDSGVVIGFRFGGSAHEEGGAKLPEVTISGMR